MPTRRAFVETALAGLALAGTGPGRHAAAAPVPGPERRSAPRPSVVRPPRLERGAAVGLINPCSVPLRPDDIDEARARVEALGLRLKEAPAIREERESAELRASDVNAMFADDSVKALLPMRGGWGCARLLAHLDYGLIAQ